MQAPWNYLLFVLAFMAGFSRVVATVNCSAITVPKVEQHYYHTTKVEVRWSHTVPNASYTAKSCCQPHDQFSIQMNDCKLCPVYVPVPNCKETNDADKITVTSCWYSYAHQDMTLNTNLSVDVPGCERKSEEFSLFIEPKIFRMTPPSRLNVVIKQAELLFTWWHDENDGGLLLLCYFYRAAEILENGERRKIIEKEKMVKSPSVLVPLSSPHAYKLFELCVKIKICRILDTSSYSEERCIQKRSPPTAPSKPLKMLCGTTTKDPCHSTVSADKKERDVTLVWKLPEKSAWNGLPTVTKMRMTTGNLTRTMDDINATQTNYTLKNLKRNALYQVQLQFCSNGGCGPSAPPVVIHPDPGPSAQPVKEADPKWIIVIVASSIVLIIAVALVVGYLLFWSKRQRSMTNLPRLQPPVHEAGQAGTDPGYYDILQCSSEETQIRLNLSDKSSQYEKTPSNSDGSSSTHSTNDSASCPLVTETPDASPDEDNVDVTYRPQRSGNASGALLLPGDRTYDI